MKVAARLFLLALFGLSLSSPSLVARPGGGVSLTLEDRLPSGVQNKAVDQFVKADVVIVGKVKAIEENCRVASAERLDLYKSAYRVAVVEVKESVLGSKAGETVRVGFRAVHSPTYKNHELREGDEGVFFLNKHHEESFLVIKQPYSNMFGLGNFGGDFGGGFNGGGFNLGGGQLGNPPKDKQAAQPTKPPRAAEFMDKDQPDYAKDLALVRRCGKLYAGGKASLKSANAGDRLLAAAVLVGKHRNLAPLRTYGFTNFGQTGPSHKNEPIDAEESRLILDVLSASNLEQKDTETGVFPLGVFKRLGLKREDNWTAPTTNQQEYAAAAQRWLHGNANTYRVQRVVEEKTTPVSTNEKPVLSNPVVKKNPPEPSPGKGAGGVQSQPKTNGSRPPAPTIQNQAQTQAKEGGLSWLTFVLVTGGAVLLTAAASVSLTLLVARKPAPPPVKKRRRVVEEE